MLVLLLKAEPVLPPYEPATPPWVADCWQPGVWGRNTWGAGSTPPTPGGTGFGTPAYKKRFYWYFRRRK